MANDAGADDVLDALIALEPPFHNHAATAYAFAAVPARLALERHDWEQAALIATGWPDGVSWNNFPHLSGHPLLRSRDGRGQDGRPRGSARGHRQAR